MQRRLIKGGDKEGLVDLAPVDANFWVRSVCSAEFDVAVFAAVFKDIFGDLNVLFAILDDFIHLAGFPPLDGHEPVCRLTGV